jgi:hypothetical protein
MGATLNKECQWSLQFSLKLGCDLMFSVSIFGFSTSKLILKPGFLS